ncbi:hypothetical protein XA3_13810 [Xylocopilactobacillus apicola]|uniref:Putative host cell surface-exposed lipoprotein Ltp-like HTH region domain-containing protein n=2 Tax=Xylocopilactobacillus apicola TaxID=2932184 RepID=A0AAU9D9B1_9LACO|nr:hypothetical protein XA3_13810 [Xylocopilactobacillus apicola]
MKHLNVKWNKMALKQAKSYAKDMICSKKVLRDRLTQSVSDGGSAYTAAQAQFAVKNLKVNWNKNALEEAKSLKRQGNSRSFIEQALKKSEYSYEKSEIDYAMKNLK